MIVSGDVRTFDLEVHNLGNVTWPATGTPSRSSAWPIVGSTATAWSCPPRTAPATGSEPIPSGGRRVVPCWLKGPTRMGRLTLELDLVHELERSFGCAIRVPVDVVDSR